MDASRVVVRYSLPGGVALFLAGFTQVALHWSWGEPLSHVLDVFGSSAIGLIFGTLTVGFITFQIYYALYRPVVGAPRHLIPNRRAAQASHKIRTRDRGGEVLSYLDDLPGDVFVKLEAVYLVRHSLADRNQVACDNVYVRQWYERNAVVRGLIDDIAIGGGSEIKKEYNELLDQYHCLGACRASVVIPQLLNIAYILWHWNHHGTGSGQWFGAILLSSVVTVTIIYGFHRSREDVWRGLVSRTGRSLRSWMIRNPTFMDSAPTVPNHPDRGRCRTQACLACRPAPAWSSPASVDRGWLCGVCRDGCIEHGVGRPGFVVSGAEHAQRGVAPAAVVEHFDVVEHFGPQLLAGRPRGAGGSVPF